MRHQRPGRRAGFTIVELLVSTALIMFIMVIIAQALGQGTKTFSTLRSAAHLSDEGRAGINILRRDLWSDHFAGPYGPHGGPHLVDQRLDQPGWKPPYQGFFEIVQLNPSRYEPGGVFKPAAYGTAYTFPVPFIDNERLISSRANDHTLRFTVLRPPGPASELFCATFHPLFTNLPEANEFRNTTGLLFSRWAQVAYFVLPTGEVAGPNQQPLGTLRRRMRLMPMRDVDFPVPMPLAQAQQFKAACDRHTNVIPVMIVPDTRPTAQPNTFIVRLPGPETVNQAFPDDVNFRVPTQMHLDGNGAISGEDIVLTNVLAFEVRAAWIHNQLFNSPSGSPSPRPEGIGEGNTDEPFSDFPRGSMLNPIYTGTRGIFDTWYTPSIVPVDWDSPDAIQNNMTGFLIPQAGNVLPPNRINVRAVQVKIRLWDPRAEQARQVTLISDV